jgi:uncharacterized protein (DUF927 family)
MCLLYNTIINTKTAVTLFDLFKNYSKYNPLSFQECVGSFGFKFQIFIRDPILAAATHFESYTSGKYLL